MTQDEIMELVRSKDGFIGHAMNIPHDRQNKTHELVLEYNQTSPADIKRRQGLLKQILGTYNERVVIQHGVHFDFGFNTHFLGMAYVNFGVTFLDTSPITIGDMCFRSRHRNVEADNNRQQRVDRCTCHHLWGRNDR